jgi:hypothetical protein
MNSALHKSFNRLVAVGFRPIWLILTPVAIGAGRILSERLLIPHHWTPKIGVTILAPYTISVILFYHIAQIAMIAFLAYASRRRSEELVGPVSVGLLLAWLPPMLDAVLPEQPQRYYSFFAAFEPDFAAAYQLMGETITLWITVAACGILVFYLTGTWWRAGLGSASAYFILQLLGWGWHAMAEQFDILAGGKGVSGGPRYRSHGS